VSLLDAVRPPDRRPGSLANSLGKLVLFPLVRVHRRRLRGLTTVVGITGSVGKTTTKHLLAAALATHGPVAPDPSGGGRSVAKRLARSVLGASRRHRYCVLEIQAWREHSIDQGVWFTEPEVGVVTTIGWDHLSSLGGPKGVAAEKGKLVAALPPTGLAVLNADDERVLALAARARCRVVTFGVAAGADVRAEDVAAAFPELLSFTLVHRGSRHPVQTRLVGEHWTTAVLAALATAVELGVPVERAVAAVEAVAPSPHRLSVRPTRAGVTYLQDDWKASAWTVPQALAALGSPPGRRIVVIGQLSDDLRKPKVLYPAVAAAALEHADHVLLVGRWAHHGLRAGAGVSAVPGAAEAHAWLRATTGPGDVVLVKTARNPVHLERLPLAHDGEAVRCWLQSCELRRWCEDCEFLAQERHEAS